MMAERHHDAIAVTPTGPFFFGSEILNSIHAFVLFMEEEFGPFGLVTVEGVLPQRKAEKDVVY